MSCTLLTYACASAINDDYCCSISGKLASHKTHRVHILTATPVYWVCHF
jgi:hypothetical protein